MRDGRVRSVIKKTLARLYLAGLRRRRARAPWVLAGECRSCASCCEAPTIAVGTMLFFFAPANVLWLWWQRVVNGFVVVDEIRQARAFVFKCTHFDPQTRRCDSYDSRPGMCRDYPRMLLESADPEFFPSCGYRAVARNGAQMIAALTARGVGGEQLVQIKSKLRLE
jgi:Fe-S-cluster containining protein